MIPETDMNRESRAMLLVAIAAIGIATLTWSVRSPAKAQAHHDADVPHHIAHAKSIGDLFPAGR